jgi:hypothetical protein
LRVNITYSVGLEEIPKEIEKLLLEGNASLKAAVEAVDSLGEKSPLEIVEELSAIRSTMGIFDMRVAECLSILSGYIDIRTKATTPILSEDTSDELIIDDESE